MTGISPQLLKQIAELAVQVQGDPHRFTGYRDRPLAFIREVLGIALYDPETPDRGGLWGGQQAVVVAVNKHRRVTVRSGHGLGKTFVLALLAIWWTYARRGRVVTTASTWNQVEKVLWSEIDKLWRNALVPLPGQMFATELRVEKGWFAMGLSTDNPTAFQGQHHPDLLVIIDEAPGVDAKVHEAIRSLATGGGNHIVMIGNPTESSGPFYESFQRGTWHRVHLDAMDHPNVVHNREIIPGAVTREWVAEQAEEYGEDSPIYASRVRGNFPASGMKSVIPRPWLTRAMAPRDPKADAKLMAGHRPVLGVDVARYGSNRTVIAVRQGPVITELRDFAGQDTMQTVGEVHRAWREVNAGLILVDAGGVGGGVVDRLLELGLPVLGIEGGRRARAKAQFGNVRSELWWEGRRWLEGERLWLPKHLQLEQELSAPTYSVTSNGKIQVERKEELQARGVSSPDFADAVLLTLAGELLEEADVELTPSGVDPAAWLAQRDTPMLQDGEMWQLPAGLPEGY